MNSGDVFIAVTKDKLFHWVGKSVNVLEKARVSKGRRVDKLCCSQVRLCWFGPAEVYRAGVWGIGKAKGCDGLGADVFLHTGLDWCVCARCETVRAYTNYVCVFFMLVSAWVAIMHASLVVSA